MKKDELIFVEHIQEAIRNIEEFVGNLSKDQFFKEKEKQYAVMRALEIIGEATKNMSPGFKKRYLTIPWEQIAGMRDKLIHHYFGVNLERVWNTVKDDLPKLKKEIKKILE